MRHIRFAPPPADWRGEYILSWFEKDGDKIHEGKWMGDLEHIVELFSRFLVQGEDSRQIWDDNWKYIHQSYKPGGWSHPRGS